MRERKTGLDWTGLDAHATKEDVEILVLRPEEEISAAATRSCSVWSGARIATNEDVVRPLASLQYL